MELLAFTIRRYIVKREGALPQAFAQWPIATQNSLTKISAELNLGGYASRTAVLLRDHQSTSAEDIEVYLAFTNEGGEEIVIGRASYVLTHREAAPYGLIYNVIVSQRYRDEVFGARGKRKGIGTSLVKQALLEGAKVPPTIPGTVFYHEAHVPAGLLVACAFFDSRHLKFDLQPNTTGITDRTYRRFGPL